MILSSNNSPFPSLSYWPKDRIKKFHNQFKKKLYQNRPLKIRYICIVDREVPEGNLNRARAFSLTKGFI